MIFRKGCLSVVFLHQSTGLITFDQYSEKLNRRKYTFEERQLILHEIKDQEILHKRKKRLYNRMYRKSPFFIWMCLIRVVYIAIVLTLFFTNDISGGFRKEVVQKYNYEYYSVRTSTRGLPAGSYQKIDIYLQTDQRTYFASLTEHTAPSLDRGDTVVIERDFMNKPIYFTHNDWEFKYNIDYVFDEILLFLNLLLFIFTVISFGFNDGLFRYNNKVLKFISLNIAISSGIYILSKLYFLFFG